MNTPVTALPFTYSSDSITVLMDNQPFVVKKSGNGAKFDKLKEALKAQDWAAVAGILDFRKAVARFSNGDVEIKGDMVLYKGKEMHNALADRLVRLLDDGFNIDPLLAFLSNLMQNPSNNSVTQLYRFLEKNQLPVTPDGCFIAYKKVNSNYTDVHSGTFNNSVGQVVTMERNEVDDDPHRTCSHGLHVCSKEYLSHFGGERTVICKVNPRDVVSVPTDYNDSKMRVCRYEVIGELGVVVNTPEQVEANAVFTG